MFASICVAFLLAFHDVVGAGALTKAHTMLDARRFLPGLRADMLFGPVPGVQLDMCGLADGSGSAAQFWQLARAFKLDLVRKFDRLKSIFIECLIGFERLHRHFDWLASGIDAPRQIRHVTFTSNMGRLKLPDYRSFKLGTIHSPMAMIHPSPANTVAIFSYAGELEFTLISDELALPFDQALAIRKRAVEILRTEAVPLQQPVPEGSLTHPPRPERV